MPETDSPPRPSPPRPDPQPTRAALIEAALELFGAKGFEGASTREIAARAGANIAAIAYHFSGKEGLRAACLDSLAGRLQAVMTVEGAELPSGPAEARDRLQRILRAAVAFIMAPGPGQDFARFMLREIVFGGPLVDAIYARILGPQHRRLCLLWGLATGTDPESEATRLAVFAMVGQMVYFRIGQPLILRRMGWEAVGPAEEARIAGILAQNLDAALAASARSAP